MKVDCQWIATNIEAYFCDGLSGEADRLARTHIENCLNCRAEVEALRNIDPLIKGLFQHELSMARAPRRQRGWLAPAAAASALGSVLIAAWMLQAPEPVDLPNPEPAADPAPASEIGIPQGAKDRQSSPVFRGKPETGDQSAPAALATPDAKSSEEFLVTDPAGYSRTYEDFRGFVLLMGVWSTDQPQSMASLERLYQTFGSETRMRILGVSNERQTKPATATFPVAYNQGSRLYGAGPSDFVVLDEAGVVKLRGSLLSDPASIVNAIRTAVRN